MSAECPLPNANHFHREVWNAWHMGRLDTREIGLRLDEDEFDVERALNRMLDARHKMLCGHGPAARGRV